MKIDGVSDENNRLTDGCVNFLPEDFDDCMKQIQGVGTKVYILPEDPNNYMCVKNGKLHFAQKKYTGDVATTTTKNDTIHPIKIYNHNRELRNEANEMAKALADKKLELASDLGIDNDTYNELATLTLGIAGQETKYGDPLAGLGKKSPYWMKENMPEVVDIVKKWKGNNSFNSRGLTQIKMGTYTDPKVQELFNKYGITKENLCQPEKASVATMIVLTCIYKNELPALKSKMEKLNVSKADALLYCYTGKKEEITGMTATPQYNIYIKCVHNFMDNFSITQAQV